MLFQGIKLLMGQSKSCQEQGMHILRGFSIESLSYYYVKVYGKPELTLAERFKMSDTVQKERFEVNANSNSQVQVRDWISGVNTIGILIFWKIIYVNGNSDWEKFVIFTDSNRNLMEFRIHVACQYQIFAKINGIKWVSPLFCVSWISWVYYISLFLFVLISGIIKTIQAIKKKTLPMNVRISWFLKLDTIKKMAHKIKSIQPIIWYFISCLSWFSCFSFIDIPCQKSNYQFLSD